MGINQNHLFEELNGIKCAIVEKNAGPARIEFLRRLLEYNRYTVVVVPSPPPKAVAAAVPSAGATPSPAATSPASPASATTEAAVAASGEMVPAAPTPSPPTPSPPAPPPPAPPPPPPETFTIGVTDVGFNPTNAVFGRLLRTSDGHIVTLAYWQQKAAESHDEIPYFAS
jgi:hypothetical protein